ncbi:MAG: phage tail sheath C-terminal domain-containing protein [Gilvibacter sp.]
MSTTYKTPGVYVEEISKFPPSVAQVETAIPAFIGYTEKASKKGESLINDPTRITSLLDYETYFGTAKAETTITVTVNDAVVNGAATRNVKVNQPTTPSAYKMYYALQMYFANGGGPCYIVSVGAYDTPGPNSVVFDALSDGLDLLEKEDEPTLLLFPDANALSDVEFYSLYANALMQCNDMQDRFTIIDTHTSVDTEDDSLGLRDGISLGKDYLKYGAAYYPYLETILDYRYTESTVIITHTSDDTTDITAALGNAQAAATNVTTHQGTANTQNTAFIALNNTYQTVTPASDALIPANMNPVSAGIQDVINTLNSVITDATPAVAAANTAATGADEDEAVAQAATDAGAALNTAITDAGSSFVTLRDALVTNLADLIGAANGTNAKAASTAAAANIANAEAEVTAVLALIDPAITTAITDAVGVDTNMNLNGLDLAAIEAVDNTAYHAIKTEIAALPITLPPSSTMAGIYARVDSDRGVWKAPANVGVNYVVKPNMKVTHDQQRDLNVHITGKSINAIRAFTGKGILVWGARTLAGNDNEWRYVPVRRFFNMVEESVERASEQFVFEPNDANTWVKIRAMIENFLTLQWRAGALAGAKPEQAFYVRVGLGETMTAEDILNGVMNIEIGMAAVRPAEFIILKFSHKMQEA